MWSEESGRIMGASGGSDAAAKMKRGDGRVILKATQKPSNQNLVDVM